MGPRVFSFFALLPLACSSPTSSAPDGAAGTGTSDSSTSGDTSTGADDGGTGASDASASQICASNSASFALAPEPAPVTFTDSVAMFHLNVQEHGWLDDSATLVTKVLDLFDSLDMRLDVYLTTWMTDDYCGKYPDLLKRILTTASISVSYHTRPPKPYRANFARCLDKDGGCVGNENYEDWYGLYKMDATQRYTEIKAFEEFGVDLKTGQRTTAEGGFKKLKRLYGRAPYVAGDEADGSSMQSVVDKVFQDMGVTFVISHSKENYEGDKRNGLLLKPEVIDAKVFTTDSSLDGDKCIEKTDGKDVFDCEMARCATSTKKPCTVAFKMHDNDFLADDSWWLTVYSKKTPEWDPTKTSKQLTAEAKDVMWKRYEQIVRRAAEMRSKYAVVGAKDWAKRAGK